MVILARGLLEVILFVIFIPLRILVTIFAIICICINTIRGVFDSFKEGWGYFVEGLTKGAKREIHWIKTGESEKLEF